MKGDFSRGDQPDRKRGRKYSRVLLQQGRLLLDSDVNALVDTLHQGVRGVANDIGCPAGSPDLGYLITPGRLLALFDTLDHVRVTSGSLEVHRDYQFKYLDRYPSLYLTPSGGGAGTATISLRASVTGDVDFWVRSSTGTGTGGIVVNGTPWISTPAGPDFDRMPTSLIADTSEIEVMMAGDIELWIGMIEQSQQAEMAPVFSVAAGRYYLKGLALENPADQPYPDLSFPKDAGFKEINLHDFQFEDPQTPGTFRHLQVDDRLFAYLEGWERHITAVEDRGLLEEALGGRVDTCTRTRSVGQVKIAPAHKLTEEQLQTLLDHRVMPDGTLAVTTPEAEVNPDPCALPKSGGYTGPDNRLYRFEVHQGGALADGHVLFKWSRNNASELFPVLSVESAGGGLAFAGDTDLRQGDLVEILSDVIDLGDQGHASVDTNLAEPTFMAAERRAGRLARLQAVTGSTAAEASFTLTEPHDPSTSLTLVLDDFGDPANLHLKVRRWHGLIRPDGSSDPHMEDIEDGIKVEFSGTFSVGDYWQYEARLRRDNANGPWQVTPHGPERLFAPLAVLRFEGDDQPLALEAWLDERYPPICELSADDIAFDGDPVHSDSDTVQEAIEELYERDYGGCCDRTLFPEEGDAAERIRQALEQTTGDIRICLKPGIYRIESNLEIGGRRIVLAGCPKALIELVPNARLKVVEKGRLVLESLIVFTHSNQDTETLVEIGGDAQGFEAQAVGLFMGKPNGKTVAIRVGEINPQTLNANAPFFEGDHLENVVPQAQPEIQIRESVILADWTLSAGLIGSLTLRDSVCFSAVGGLSCQYVFATDIVDSRIVCGLHLGQTGQWKAKDLLQSPEPWVDKIATLEPVSPVNAAIAGYAYAQGAISGCRLEGGYGAAITLGTELNFTGNTHLTAMKGISLASAQGVHLEGERIVVKGQHPPGDDGGKRLRVGIHLAIEANGDDTQGEWFTIRDCSIESDLGIVLAADVPETPFSTLTRRTLHGVRIVGNQIGASVAGIQIGPVRGKVQEDVQALVVESNRIQAGFVGVFSRGPIASQHSLLFSEVKMAQNMITASIAIFVQGARFEIEDNRLGLPQRSEQPIGLFAQNTDDLVAENNLVEVDARFHADGSPVLSPALIDIIKSKFAELYNFTESELEKFTHPQDSSFVFLLVGGRDGRLSGNVVKVGDQVQAVALQIQNHPGLQVIDNDFGPSDCRLTSVRDVTFRGNRSAQVSITRTISGTVGDNRVFRTESEFQGSLIIARARGHWQITNNWVDGSLMLEPGLRLSHGGLFDYFELSELVATEALSINGHRFEPAIATALVEIASRSRNPEFARLLTASEGFSPTDSTSHPPAPETTFAASELSAVANTNWTVDWDMAGPAFVNGGIATILPEADSSITINPVSLANESPYQAQVTANRCGRLQVGSALATTIGSTDTIVLVVANHVDGLLIVKPYKRRVVANNISEDKYPSGSFNTVAAAIIEPNLDV